MATLRDILGNVDATATNAPGQVGSGSLRSVVAQREQNLAQQAVQAQKTANKGYTPQQLRDYTAQLDQRQAKRVADYTSDVSVGIAQQIERDRVALETQNKVRKMQGLPALPVLMTNLSSMDTINEQAQKQKEKETQENLAKFVETTTRKKPMSSKGNVQARSPQEKTVLEAMQQDKAVKETELESKFEAGKSPTLRFIEHLDRIATDEEYAKQFNESVEVQNLEEYFAGSEEELLGKIANRATAIGVGALSGLFMGAETKEMFTGEYADDIKRLEQFYSEKTPIAYAAGNMAGALASQIALQSMAVQLAQGGMGFAGIARNSVAFGRLTKFSAGSSYSLVQNVLARDNFKQVVADLDDIGKQVVTDGLVWVVGGEFERAFDKMIKGVQMLDSVKTDAISKVIQNTLTKIPMTERMFTEAAETFGQMTADVLINGKVEYLSEPSLVLREVAMDMVVLTVLGNRGLDGNNMSAMKRDINNARKLYDSTVKTALSTKNAELRYSQFQDAMEKLSEDMLDITGKYELEGDVTIKEIEKLLKYITETTPMEFNMKLVSDGNGVASAKDYNDTAKEAEYSEASEQAEVISDTKNVDESLADIEQNIQSKPGSDEIKERLDKATLQAVPVTPELFEFATFLKDNFGAKIVFGKYDDPILNKQFETHGYYNAEDGTIFINTESSKAMQSTMMHEILHSIKASDAKSTIDPAKSAYDILRESVKAYVDTASTPYTKRVKEFYSKQDNDSALFDEEYIAELFSELTDGGGIEFWVAMVNQDYKTVRTILGGMKKAIKGVPKDSDNYAILRSIKDIKRTIAFVEQAIADFKLAPKTTEVKAEDITKTENVAEEVTAEPVEKAVEPEAKTEISPEKSEKPIKKPTKKPQSRESATEKAKEPEFTVEQEGNFRVVKVDGKVSSVDTGVASDKAKALIAKIKKAESSKREQIRLSGDEDYAVQLKKNTEAMNAMIDDIKVLDAKGQSLEKYEKMYEKKKPVKAQPEAKEVENRVNELSETFADILVNKLRAEGNYSDEVLSRKRDGFVDMNKTNIKAFQEGDIERILGVVHQGNPTTIRLFNTVTNSNVKTNKDLTERLGVLYPEKYDEYNKKKEYEKLKKEQEEKAEKQKESIKRGQDKANEILNARYSYYGRVLPFTKWVDRLIATGFVDVKEVKNDKIKMSKISLSNGQYSHEFTKVMEKEYVLKRISQLKNKDELVGVFKKTNDKVSEFTDSEYQKFKELTKKESAEANSIRDKMREIQVKASKTEKGTAEYKALNKEFNSLKKQEKAIEDIIEVEYKKHREVINSYRNKIFDELPDAKFEPEAKSEEVKPTDDLKFRRTKLDRAEIREAYGIENDAPIKETLYTVLESRLNEEMKREVAISANMGELNKILSPLKPIASKYAKQAESVVGLQTLEADFEASVSAISNVFRKVGTMQEVIAQGYSLIEAYNKAGEFNKSQEVLIDMASVLSENGKALQAAQLISKGSKIGYVKFLNRELAKLNQQGRSEFKSKWNDFYITDEEFTALLNTKDGDFEAREMIKAAIGARIVSEMPRSLKYQLEAWRKFSMLSSVRTHYRNILSNVMNVPVRQMREGIHAALDLIINAKHPELRTHSFKRGKDLTRIAKQSYLEIKSELAKNNTDIVSLRNVFGVEVMPFKVEENTKVKKWFQAGLNSAIKGNQWLMNDFEDMPFFKSAYVSTLTHYMSAQNLTEVTPEAKAYALSKALKYTFKQQNSFTRFLESATRKNAWGGVIDLIMPFRKTPINIFIQNLESSPLGLAISVKKAIDLKEARATTRKVALEGYQAELRRVKRMSGITEAQRTKFESDAKKKYQEKLANVKIDTMLAQANMIESLAANATGVLGIIVGMVLAGLGVITGEPEDEYKKAEYRRTVGESPVALRIGNAYLPINWAQPAMFPVIFGATLRNAMDDRGITDLFSKEVIGQVGTATLSTFDSTLELPMFKGIQELLGGSKSTDSEGGYSIAANAFATLTSSFALQMIPNILTDLTNARTQYVKTSWTPESAEDEEEGFPDAAPYFWRVLLRKLSQKTGVGVNILQNKVDIWGNDVERQTSVLRRVIQSTAFPTQVTYDKRTPVDDEVLRLMEEYDTSQSIIPPTAPKYLNGRGAVDVEVDGKIGLNTADYANWQRTAGKTAYGMLDRLFKLDSYKGMSDDAKKELVETVYTFAKNKADNQIYKEKGLSGIEFDAGFDKVFFETLKVSSGIGSDASIRKFPVIVSNKELSYGSGRVFEMSQEQKNEYENLYNKYVVDRMNVMFANKTYALKSDVIKQKLIADQFDIARKMAMNEILTKYLTNK
jgi:hypothetical protein